MSSVTSELTAMDATRFKHTPYYCEENVYLLCKTFCENGVADAAGSDLFVVFISNEKKQASHVSLIYNLCSIVIYYVWSSFVLELHLHYNVSRLVVEWSKFSLKAQEIAAKKYEARDVSHWIGRNLMEYDLAGLGLVKCKSLCIKGCSRVC